MNDETQNARLVQGDGNVDDGNTAHETSPLLVSERPSSPPPPHRIATPWYQLKKPQHIASIICLGIFLWVLSGTLAFVPVMQLAEGILCRRYYRGHPDELQDGIKESCKIAPIQSHMAFLFAFAFMLNGVISLLVAFPFSVLADKARKPVYMLGAIGQSLYVGWTLLVFYFSETLPIELVLIGSAFQFLGGGLIVAISVMYAMMSDVLAADSRSTWFFFFSISAQIAAFVGLPIASRMMEVWSPWAPLTVTMLLGPLNALFMALVPETLKPVDGEGVHDLPAPNGSPARKRVQPELRQRLRQHITDARDSLKILRKRSVALIILSLVIISLVNQQFIGVFIQYYSIRFHRSLEQAGYILSIRGGVVIIFMGVVLPLLTKLLSKERTGLSPYRRDLSLARGSAVILCVGFLVLSGPSVGFVVSGLILVTLGSGVAALCRSLVTNFAEPTQTSRLFTLISILETVCSLPSGPLLAWAFSVGMRLQGMWYGLPFLILAMLGLGAGITLTFLPRDLEEDGSMPTSHDEEERLVVDHILPLDPE